MRYDHTLKSKIDDIVYPGSGGSGGEVLRCLDITGAESLVTAHAVDEVVGGFDALHRRGQSLRFEHVADGDLDFFFPGTAV